MQKKYYLYIVALCWSFIGYALFLQHLGWEGVLYAPCPLCILQRLAYLGIAKACLLAYLLPRYRKACHALGVLAGLLGLGVSARHLWVIANPTVSCGLDPLEIWINQWSLVRWFDWILKADGLCSAPLPPVFGVTVPVWSFIWLVILTITLTVTYFTVNVVDQKLGTKR